MLWWEKQSANAVFESLSNIPERLDLLDALAGFASFLEECGATALVGNGVSFDNVIIRHAIDKLDVAMPAGFDTRKDFCYRTAKKMLPWIKPPEFIGIPHHALYDALHEAGHLNAVLNELAVTEYSRTAKVST
jgi:exodeoxyribonuclease VIII